MLHAPQGVLGAVGIQGPTLPQMGAAPQVQPLGGVNRARNEPYRVSDAFRAKFHGCPMHEPRAPAQVV